MFTKTARTRVKFASSNNHFHEYPSNGLADLLKRVSIRGSQRHRKFRVLDLGPARQSVLELSALKSFRLQVADVVSDLDIVEADPRSIYSIGEFSETDWDNCLPAEDGSPIDAVLSWDIFNYLGIEDIGSLSRCLSRRCNPGAFLHSIVYTGETMPLNPLQFDLLLPATLYRSQKISDYTTPSPRYGHALTQKSLGSFVAEHLFQLDADLQEEVYIYRGSQA